MNKILIVCKSVTDAQKVMNIISKNGFWAIISRTPSDINMKSCSYSVNFYEKDYIDILNTLRYKGIEPTNIYQYTDGYYKKIGGVI